MWEQRVNKLAVAVVMCEQIVCPVRISNLVLTPAVTLFTRAKLRGKYVCLPESLVSVFYLYYAAWMVQVYSFKIIIRSEYFLFYNNIYIYIYKLHF